MSIPNEILLVLVAGIAFYLGYRMGRMSVLSELSAPRHAGPPDIATADAAGPLPGPASSQPSRPRAAPPPASAGGDAPRPAAPSSSPAGPNGTTTPRRTAAPPPARAGLLDTGDGRKKQP